MAIRSECGYIHIYIFVLFLQELMWSALVNTEIHARKLESVTANPNVSRTFFSCMVRVKYLYIMGIHLLTYLANSPTCRPVLDPTLSCNIIIVKSYHDLSFCLKQQ